MEDAVAVGLEHPRVRIETRVTQLGDLLGEQFNSVGGVTEYNGLVDLELRWWPSARELS